MTWIDFAILAIFIFFIVMGARLGSLWTGACIVGGFFGAALVDVYSLPVSTMMGNFPGSVVLAAILLYVGGLAVVLIPGAVLSKISSVFILHLIDGAFGLVTGAFVAFLLVSAILVTAGPVIPGFESSSAFKNSRIARPLDRVLDEALSHLPFRSARRKIGVEAGDKISSLTKGIEKTVHSLKK